MPRKRLAIIVSFIVVLVFLTNFITPVKASTISRIYTWELTFNPSGPYFYDQRLNPFAIPEIREAMNQLIDRQWIADNIFGGNATPLWLPISHYLDEYPDVKTEYDALEAAYAHDITTAESIISTELLNLAAYKVGDLWYYAGEPLEIIMVIRVEDERQAIGDYVKGLLEDIGFTVAPLYKTSTEAAPIWFASDPAEGQWHIYTGAWLTYAESGKPWDELDNFQVYYTQDSPYNFSPLWAAYDPNPAFRALADDLEEDLFATPTARHDALVSGLEYALKDSVRIWLAERPFSNFYVPLMRR